MKKWFFFKKINQAQIFWRNFFNKKVYFWDDEQKLILSLFIWNNFAFEKNQFSKIFVNFSTSTFIKAVSNLKNELAPGNKSCWPRSAIFKMGLEIFVCSVDHEFFANLHVSYSYKNYIFFEFSYLIYNIMKKLGMLRSSGNFCLSNIIWIYF